MKHFERAYQRWREAAIQLSKAIEKDFPIGSMVFYDHGNYERYGQVTMHGNDRVRIATSSQKEIWIDAYRIKRVALPVHSQVEAGEGRK